MPAVPEEVIEIFRLLLPCKWLGKAQEAVLMSVPVSATEASWNIFGKPPALLLDGD